MGVLGAFVALLLVNSLPTVGQEGRPEDSRVFTGETQVVAIEVPVQVLVDGEPVRGLTAEDFRIYEEGEPRPLTGFEVVDLAVTTEPPGPGTAAASASAPEAAPAFAVPPAGRRHFLLFFDLAFTEAGNLSRGLESARSLVREGLHPSDLVGVAFYTSRQGVALALQFTPDRPHVERVLDAFELLLDGKRELPPEVVADLAAARRSDPLGLTARSLGAALVEVGQAAGYQTSDFAEQLEITLNTGSGPGGFLIDNLLAHSAAFMEQAYEEQRSAQAAYLADNVEALARALRGIEGSKHLVLLSQGFDAQLLEIRNGAAAVGAGGGGWLLRAVNEMITELRRSGWVLHGVDLGGIAEGPGTWEAARMKGSLFFLAEETGGTLVENTNDLAAGLGAVLERTSVTYVLTFQVDDVREDGAFHPIRVELVSGPRSAKLVHRAGYHAPRPPEERSPFELRAETAVRILAGVDSGGLPATVRTTVLRYDGERARVPVLVEVRGGELLGSPSAGGPVELYVYAFDAAGSVADFFASSPGLESETRDGAAEGPPAAGVKLAGELELSPGRYTIRTLLRGPNGEREAVRSTVLEVPSPAAGPALLPPLFVESGGERWTVAALADGDGGAEYPFVLEGRRFTPSAVPVLAPGQTVRLLLPGIGLSREGVRLETRIVDAAGRAVTVGRLEVLGRRPPEAGQPDLLVAQLDTAGLAPGAYSLEVALAGSSAPVRARFRVEGGAANGVNP